MLVLTLPSTLTAVECVMLALQHSRAAFIVIIHLAPLQRQCSQQSAQDVLGQGPGFSSTSILNWLNRVTGPARNGKIITRLLPEKLPLSTLRYQPQLRVFDTFPAAVLHPPEPLAQSLFGVSIMGSSVRQISLHRSCVHIHRNWPRLDPVLWAPSH